MKIVRENIKPIIVLSIMLYVMIMQGCSTFLHIELDPDIKSFLNMIFIMAISYYIGSTTGQAKKDEIINELTKK